ncbi:MAG: Fe-S cluster assembly protein SufD [Acidobacteriia bacterium]|nr:Fe-S cluster assembly protein SufD [Terriglobia bacterium]
MIEIKGELNAYLSDFARFEKAAAGKSYPWLVAIRKEAAGCFAESGFPTTRDEEWRHTNVAEIAGASFKLSRPGTNGITAGKLGNFIFSDIDCSNLVFVNGFYSPDLSTPGALPKGVRTGSLAAVLQSEPKKVEPYLARHASCRKNAFVALNTAFMLDGGFIYLPPETILKKIIHLLFVSTSEAQATVSHPRNLVVVGGGSQVSVVESYIGPQGGVYFTNAVTEIIAGDGAAVAHYKLQRESDDAYHVASLHVLQEENADVSSHSISMGGSLTRNDITAVMNGEGGELSLNGLYVTRGRQHVDNHTGIDHAKPHCNSREMYKGILDDQSSGVFNGKILVRPNAQKTNAKQTNKNLLLSQDALVNTTPQLEIFADDVKCTHGATIGRLSDEALFYLRSRGIGEEAARALLTYAFASDIIATVKIKPLQCQLDLALLARMSRVEGVG